MIEMDGPLILVIVGLLIGTVGFYAWYRLSTPSEGVDYLGFAIIFLGAVMVISAIVWSDTSNIQASPGIPCESSTTTQVSTSKDCDVANAELLTT